jgi:hypothetical protein
LKKEKKIQELNAEILSLKTTQNELLELKEVSNDTKAIELSEEEMAEYINKNKCVMVGGMNSWQDNLKKYIPSCRFVKPEDLNVDLDFLLNADLVLFNETINNHSMYRKIKSILSNTNIPLCYNGSNTNIKIT